MLVRQEKLLSCEKMTEEIKEAPLRQRLDTYDSERIAVGDVCKEEIQDLEETLLTMYVQLAKDSGKDLIIHTNVEEYNKLKESQQIFDDENNLYLLMDPYHSKILDMNPVVFHLAYTEAGLFYAKYFMLRDECPLI